MKIRPIPILLVFLFGSMFLSVNSAGAAISLNVSPVEGGASLRLGRIDEQTQQSKEVRIRVNSSDGKQYQVFQRISAPLSNAQGANLPHGAFKTYTLVGSNAYGTLYSQDISSVGYSDQLLYTSNPNGDGDSFTVIYSVDGKDLRAAGNFLGQILYTVRAPGAGQGESFLNISLDAGLGFQFKAETSSGQGVLKLDSLRAEGIPSTIKLSFSGNSGSEVRIFQEMDQPLLNEQGDVLGSKTVLLTVEGDQGEAAVTSPVNLERKRTLLFSSRSSEGTAVMQLALDPAEIGKEKSGSYSGKISLIAELNGREERSSIDLFVEIKPEFKLEVEYPPEGVRFSSLLPDSPPQVKEVLVKVLTNLGKPFAVNQTVSDELKNEQGKALDPKYFNVRVEPVGSSGGRPDAVDFVPVAIGDSSIYHSDAKGSSVEFKVIYRLSPYPEIQAGNYTTGIVFSLQQM